LKILCDDLETEIGKVKFSLTGGDRYIEFNFFRGHNGIKSMVSSFGCNSFEKIKIGIGRPESKNPEVVANWVLQEFPQTHLEKIKSDAFPKIIKQLNLLV
jgi:PTH1 family peptidyl-tRNA hydrolase